MDGRNIRRVFEQVKPTPAQEEAMLARLFSEERTNRPMKQLKKITAALVAAALLLMTCACAVVSGLDQTLLRYLGVEAEEEPLLSPMAVPLDITVEDSGCTLKVKQALADRYSAMILFEFTAPEGTVLDGNLYSIGSYKDMIRTTFPEILNSNERSCSWGFGWTLLEDEDPADNQISLIYTMEAMSGEPELLGSTLSFTLDQLQQGVPDELQVVLQGDWSCSFTLPAEDSGQTYSVREPVIVDGKEIMCTSVYLSPLSLVVGLTEDEVWVTEVFDSLSEGWADQIFLNTKDGETIALGTDRWMSTQVEHPEQPNQLEGGRFSFRPERIIDPREIASLTFFGTTIPLES